MSRSAVLADLAEREPAEAIVGLKEPIERATIEGEVDTAATALVELGRARRALGHVDLAEQSLVSALRLAPAPVRVCHIRPTCQVILRHDVDQDRPERAWSGIDGSERADHPWLDFDGISVQPATKPGSITEAHDLLRRFTDPTGLVGTDRSRNSRFSPDAPDR